jgi:tetratricopeptide (TPR) repeat protein
MSLASGQSLNPRFPLIRRLGEGGMAEVWLVRDLELAEEVVAKILPAGASPDRVALLRRECRQARKLTHPNIVRVFDLHQGDDGHFITMEYVEGGDIRRFRGATPAEIVSLLIPVADALAHAHDLGVIHRDVKVGNVLCDASGRPLLADFGIAGVLQAEDDAVELRGGGSRFSVSPQQLAGEEPRPADDVYSFGVLIYELITGHPPFWPGITAERIHSETPAPMRSVHAIPARLQDMVARMLAKSPAERPADMTAVRTELQAIGGELPAAGEPMAAPARAGLNLTPPPRVAPIQPIPPPRSAPGTPAPSLPGGGKPSRPRPERQWRVLIPVGLLILLAVAVFTFLPRWAPRVGAPEESRTTPDAAAATTQAGEQAVPLAAPSESDVPVIPMGSLAERPSLSGEAEATLARALGLLESLEERQADLWGGKEYRLALEEMEVGDELLKSGQEAGATEAYARALELLEAVETRAGQALRQALDDGDDALAAGDAAVALAAYESALAIQPGNADAATGLRRAEVLDKVMALLDAGAREESRGNMSNAEASYRQAGALDPLSTEAAGALARIRAQIHEDRFRQAMSAGLAALDRGDHGAARESFRRAADLQPGSALPADGLTRVDAAEKRVAIAGHRSRGAELEAREDWRGAAAEYKAALALEPALKFAQEGSARSLKRADLAERLQYQIDHPDRLSSDAVLEEARDLLEEAAGVEPTGPRHRAQIAGLEEILAVAAISVRVILESDKRTEVVVYKVGRLGTFERHELELRPGTYTVVGTRAGYRDVRKELVVVAGEQPAPLVIRCTERI